jgi:hypothetical protein
VVVRLVPRAPQVVVVALARRVLLARRVPLVRPAQRVPLVQPARRVPQAQPVRQARVAPAKTPAPDRFGSSSIGFGLWPALVAWERVSRGGPASFSVGRIRCVPAECRQARFLSYLPRARAWIGLWTE